MLSTQKHIDVVILASKLSYRDANKINILHQTGPRFSSLRFLELLTGLKAQGV